MTRLLGSVTPNAFLTGLAASFICNHLKAIMMVTQQLTSDEPNVNVDLNISTSELRRVDPYQDILGEAAQRAQNYIRSIRERHVGVSCEAIEKLPILGGPLTKHGQDPSYIVQLLDEIGSPATMASMGGRFFCGVICGAFAFRGVGASLF